jgi:nicotinamidase/pyrazinamidase
LATGLHLPEETQTVSKGTYYLDAGYSAFDETNLVNRPRMIGCSRVFIGGLATDYCVRETAIDALRVGFEALTSTTRKL